MAILQSCLIDLGTMLVPTLHKENSICECAVKTETLVRLMLLYEITYEKEGHIDLSLTLYVQGGCYHGQLLID